LDLGHELGAHPAYPARGRAARRIGERRARLLQRPRLAPLRAAPSPVRAPHPIGALADLVQAAAGRDALRRLRHDVGPRAAARLVVAALEEEPRVRALQRPAARPGADQVPAPAQLLALEREVDPPARVALPRVALGVPRSSVPEEHRAAAVLALRDHALEVAVVERTVLDLHRQALHLRVQAGALGHRPAPQHAAVLEAEVAVEVARVVLLDDEDRSPGGALAALGPVRLRGAREVALASTFPERHDGALGLQ